MFPIAAHRVSGTEVTLSLSISWTDCFCWLEMIQKVKGDRNKNRSGSWKVFRGSPGRRDMRWRNPATVFQPLQSLLIHLKVFLFSSCRPFPHEGLTPFANTFIDVLSKKHCFLKQSLKQSIQHCRNATTRTALWSLWGNWPTAEWRPESDWPTHLGKSGSTAEALVMETH